MPQGILPGQAQLGIHGAPAAATNADTHVRMAQVPSQGRPKHLRAPRQGDILPSSDNLHTLNIQPAAIEHTKNTYASWRLLTLVPRQAALIAVSQHQTNRYIGSSSQPHRSQTQGAMKGSHHSESRPSSCQTIPLTRYLSDIHSQASTQLPIRIDNQCNAYTWPATILNSKSHIRCVAHTPREPRG